MLAMIRYKIKVSALGRNTPLSVAQNHIANGTIISEGSEFQMGQLF